MSLQGNACNRTVFKQCQALAYHCCPPMCIPVPSLEVVSAQIVTVHRSSLHFPPFSVHTSFEAGAGGHQLGPIRLGHLEEANMIRVMTPDHYLWSLPQPQTRLQSMKLPEPRLGDVRRN